MPESAEEKATRLEKELEAERGRGRGGQPTEQGRTDARKLLNRHRGRAEEAIAALVDENKDLRVERRELREKVAAISKPGTVILSADDAKEYEGFKALGKKAADLKKELDGVPELRAKVADHDRRAIAEEAAPLVGYNAAALRELITDKRLEISFRDDTKEGKPVRIPLVKVAGDDKAQPIPLTEYATKNLTAYIPALTAKPSTGSTQQSASTTGGKVQTPHVEQSSGSSTAQNGDGKPRPVSQGNTYLTPSQRNAKQNA